MNQKIIIGIITVVFAIATGIGIVTILDNKNNGNHANNIPNNESQGSEFQEENEISSTPTENNKILVVYYSAQNHTKAVAEKIAQNLNADVFEIVPVNKYTSDDLNWTNNNSRVSKEYNDQSLRDVELITTKVNNWDSYDTVLIGYPIWWGIAAWPVNNFVKDNNFNNKKVIPFCTSASSDLGQSGKLLENLTGTGNWQTGIRFRESASDIDIKSFTDTLK